MGVGDGRRMGSMNACHATSSSFFCIILIIKICAASAAANKLRWKALILCVVWWLFVWLFLPNKDLWLRYLKIISHRLGISSLIVFPSTSLHLPVSPFTSCFTIDLIMEDYGQILQDLHTNLFTLLSEAGIEDYRGSRLLLSEILSTPRTASDVRELLGKTSKKLIKDFGEIYLRLQLMKVEEEEEEEEETMELDWKKEREIARVSISIPFRILLLTHSRRNTSKPRRQRVRWLGFIGLGKRKLWVKIGAPDIGSWLIFGRTSNERSWMTWKKRSRGWRNRGTSWRRRFLNKRSQGGLMKE